MPLPHPDELPKIISSEVARQPEFRLGPNDWIDSDDEPLSMSSVNPKTNFQAGHLVDGYDRRSIALNNEPADELLNHPDGIDWV